MPFRVVIRIVGELCTRRQLGPKLTCQGCTRLYKVVAELHKRLVDTMFPGRLCPHIFAESDRSLQIKEVQNILFYRYHLSGHQL